jgi:hypothetical protein
LTASDSIAKSNLSVCNLISNLLPDAGKLESKECPTIRRCNG